MTWSLVVQWLRLCTPNAGGLGLIPGQETTYQAPPSMGFSRQEYSSGRAGLLSLPVCLISGFRNITKLCSDKWEKLLQVLKYVLVKK